MAINTGRFQITVLKQGNTEQYSIYIPYDVAINTGRFQITVLKQGNTEQYSDETEQYTAETEQYSVCIPYDMAINTGRFQITVLKQRKWSNTGQQKRIDPFVCFLSLCFMMFLSMWFYGVCLFLCFMMFFVYMCFVTGYYVLSVVFHQYNP